MFLDLPFQANLIMAHEKRQQVIDDNLRRQNRKRRVWDYAVGQEVLIKAIEPNKLQARAHGPYPIAQVYVNGTDDVQRNNNVIERINIRRLIPYRR